MSFYSVQSFDSTIKKNNCILSNHKQQGFGTTGSSLPFDCISERKWGLVIQNVRTYTMTSYMKLLFYQEPCFTLQKGSLDLSTKQLKGKQQQVNVPLLCLRKVYAPIMKQPRNLTWCGCKCRCYCKFCILSSGQNHLSICHQKDPQEPLTDHCRFLPDFKLMAICHKKSSSSHFYSAASQGLD